MIEQRDLLLVPFPFSDQSGRKVRPVVVISNNSFNGHSQDVIVSGVTSNVKKERYSINLTNKNLEQGKLMTNCMIKVENILRLEKELVIKKIGKIDTEKFIEMQSVLDKILR
ncbi:type II toxin-antitoxin system PemK/MazF family toxin [Candidatus Pacearchaeota archaeon CG10_big_fil_rev_8_21_14_0_10_34_76]|nr:MAG: type II toxin-antitoxin system PemK/MazF family toxin [Candidatus Pacearchaeota archaeon CG10_big_fil_rev_8_21_14_0_10_34_76]